MGRRTGNSESQVRRPNHSTTEPPTYLCLVLPQLATLVSLFILILPSLMSLFFLPCMFLPHSWPSSHPPCSWLWYGSHHWHIFSSLQTWLLQLHLSKLQLNHLQHIQNAVARAVAAAPRCSNPDRILKSLHWVKVQEHIEYKVISTTYKFLQSSSPCYLCDLITVQPSQSTASSTLVSLLQIPLHKPLFSTCCTSVVQQASSYSSCSWSSASPSSSSSP